MPWKEKARIYATLLIGKIEDFDKINDHWNAYIEQVEQYFIANEIKEEKKVAVMLSPVGIKTYGLLRNLSTPAKLSDVFFKTICGLMKHYRNMIVHLSPKPLLIAERFRFHKRNQLEGEPVSTYLGELKKLTLYCESGASLPSIASTCERSR